MDIINNLPITNENYAVALDLLTKRFNKVLPIINAHIKGLLDVPPLTKSNNVLLRQFITQVNKHWKSLEALDVPVDQWDLLLVHIYSKNLDFQTKQAFELEREEDVLPTLSEFINFLEKRCFTLEALASNSSSDLKQKVTRYSHVASEGPKDKNSASWVGICLYCKQNNHSIYKCIKFAKIAAQQRKLFILKNRLCLNCFASQHMVSQCTSERVCKLCKQKHHSLLHDCYSTNSAPSLSVNSDQKPKNQSETANASVEQIISSLNTSTVVGHTNDCAQNNCLFSNNESQILLATARVRLEADNGNTVTARALLDSGSQTTFISSETVRKLGISSKKYNVQISGIANSKATVHGSVNLNIRSVNDSFILKAHCAILDKITCALPHTMVDMHQLALPHNLQLADKEFNIPAQIDLLIGADLYFEIILPGIIKLGHRLPTLQNSHFGWVVAGPAPVEKSSLFSVALFTSPPDINEIIPQFWQLEECPRKQFLSAEDNLCETIFTNSTKRLPDGSFQVNLPFKNEKDSDLLGDSYYFASKRFYALERRFAIDPNLFCQYKEFIQEYVSLKHAKFISHEFVNSISPQRSFLPHHAVMKDHKIRVVFDCSMKTSSGYSLNDLLLKGPTVQAELFDIICRFRCFEFVITADIQKMYRQVKINPNQVYLQNILWRENSDDPLQCLELQTVTYGAKSAPYLATRCLVQLAEDSKLKFPLAAEAVLHQCYVDDILSGANSQRDLLNLRNQLVEMLNSGGFSLHKWHYNGFFSCQDEQVSMEELILKDSDNKILGISWNSTSDIFKINSPPLDQLTSFSKRQVLSRLSQLYDPLGFISPIVVIAKILMQTIWQRKLEWDEQLPSDIVNKWQIFYTGITHLNEITIPRWLFSNSDYTEVQLCGFSDSSIKAYGAVVYIRTIYPDGTVSVNLVCSKSRVAPLKTVTLPRLELCGALLLAQLVHRLKSIFHLNFSKTTLWTDSQIVLHWINGSPARWTTFVANRVSELQELSTNCSWQFVQSADNPADLISRGVDALSLSTNNFWWHGPNFLQDANYPLETPFLSPMLWRPSQSKEKLSCIRAVLQTLMKLSQNSLAFHDL